jgi:GH15 family glucan-1,4-alpha-glucosidase
MSSTGEALSAPIGNCQIAAEVDAHGDIVWAALPSLASDPVFSTRVSAERGGSCWVRPASGGEGQQRYLGHSNVLETRFDGPEGSFRVLDFAPRFIQYDRVFRPPYLVRVLEPLAGTPLVTVGCAPKVGWAMGEPVAVPGSGTIEFGGFAAPLRLTTDLSLTALGSGAPFVLNERRHLVITWGATIEEPLGPLCERFLSETLRHWEHWVRGCNLPPWYQRDVLRAALSLKLHCFEDTGAVVEGLAPPPGGGAEARLFQLSEAPRAADAFLQLGLFSERERLGQFLLNLATQEVEAGLHAAHWPDGKPFPGHAEPPGPDVPAALVVAVTPLLLDVRFAQGRSEGTLQVLERLTQRAITGHGAHPGGERGLRTWPNVTRWAAAARMAVVAAHHAPDLESGFRASAARLHHEVATRAWNHEIKSFVGSYDGRDLDARLLHLPALGFLSPQDPRLRFTVDAIWSDALSAGAAKGTTAPTRPDLRTLWLTHALAQTGRSSEARAVMGHAQTALTPVGVALGPSPARTVSAAVAHAGVIGAAFAASPKWHELM